jgi:TetR/AcrR family transcriptional repressor of nem operon
MICDAVPTIAISRRLEDLPLNTKRKASGKREQLLHWAQRLILRQGYSATTIDMICAASNLSKGVFFHYFQNKKDLGTQALHEFFDHISARLLSSAQALAGLDPLQRVESLVFGISRILSSRVGPRGCLIATFVIESAETEPELRKHCAEYFRQWATLLQQPLEEAIRQYAPESELDSERLSYYCISMIEGSLLLARAQRDTTVVEHNAELLMTHLHQLLGLSTRERSLPSASASDINSAECL